VLGLRSPLTLAGKHKRLGQLSTEDAADAGTSAAPSRSALALTRPDGTTKARSDPRHRLKPSFSEAMPLGNSATILFRHVVFLLLREVGNAVQTTVEVSDLPLFFTGNKTDSVQLSTVNATKTPEAR
jgi:hypothetical protein